MASDGGQTATCPNGAGTLPASPLVGWSETAVDGCAQTPTGSAVSSSRPVGANDAGTRHPQGAATVRRRRVITVRADALGRPALFLNLCVRAVPNAAVGGTRARRADGDHAGAGGIREGTPASRAGACITAAALTTDAIPEGDVCGAASTPTIT